MIRLIINVESQYDYHPGYPLTKRGIYYCSRLISAQYGVEFAHAHYEGMKKVYSIWICSNPPRHRENAINRYRLREEHICGAVEEPEENYDLMTLIMIYLGNVESSEEVEALKLLNVLLSATIQPENKKKILHEEFRIPMTQEMERSVGTMCNLSEGVWRKGVEEGRTEGRAEGRMDTLVQNVQNIMTGTSWTASQAMDLLNIPEGDREAILQRL